MSLRIQKYELTQNNRRYILSTQIEGENIKLTCKEFGIVTDPNPPEYIGTYSLDQLRQLSEFFISISTILEALKLLNQTVENQNVSVEHVGNNINIILYFTTESEEEDSSAMRIELVKDPIYNKPIIYHSYVESPTQPVKELPTQIKTKTTESTIGTIYSPLKRLPDIQTNLPQLQTITTPTKEVNITSSNETYKNYENVNLNNEVPINTDEYNTIFNNWENQAQTTSYNLPYITPVAEEPQITYDPIIESPKREQIQYTIPSSASTAEITYSAVTSKKNPELLKQQKIVETTTTTTRQMNPSIDMSKYNQKISELENETSRIKSEYEKLKGDSNNLSTELGQLRAKIQMLSEENKALREQNKKDENHINEISLLNQEIQMLRTQLNQSERLRRELEQNQGIQNSFDQYKKIKEEEINYLKAQIEELLKNQRKSDEMLINKQKEINDLKNQNQIQQMKILEFENKLQQQQEIQQQLRQTNTSASKIANQTLTIHNSRTELIKGEIIDSTSELELLTRKICKNHKKITLNLIYKASVDTDKAEAFHNKCDWLSKTLVLIKSGKGKRFGGYTTCSWKGDGIDKKDENAFIFSLDKMQIYDILPGEDAIGCYPGFGPVFSGCQIRIFDDFFTNGGTTFEKGVNYNTKEDYELTGGYKRFNVKEIEVYSVELQ